MYGHALEFGTGIDLDDILDGFDGQGHRSKFKVIWLRKSNFLWVLKISVIQSDAWALPRISATISKMALKSAGTSVLRNQFSAGLEYQLEFPWNF